MFHNERFIAGWRHHRKVLISLFLIVGIFWAILPTRTPEYNYCEIEAISKVNLRTMWSWIDYGPYYRYSPTGLLFFGLIDRHLIAPLCGINFSDIQQSYRCKRLLPFFFLSFILISLLTYWFTWKLFANRWAAFFSALYMGVNKAFFYFFYYTDSLALSLLMIYALCFLIFWKKYLDSRRNSYLIGYYLFLLLCVGAWEQWINLLIFLIIFSIYLLIRKRGVDWRIMMHGILIPLLIFSVYISLRYPSIIKETSSIKEAQYVFSYPAKSMMIEDMVVNASLHIADTIDSLLIPWPLLSQSVLHNYDMNKWNPFNVTYAPYPSMHYRFLTDWYAGFLFCFFLVITVLFITYLRKNREEEYAGVIGMLLIWTGFIIHLPVMYRAYFAMPGYLLGYKHLLSILGFSIFLGWAIKKLSPHLTHPPVSKGFYLLLSIWIIYCNYGKIMLSLKCSYPW